MFYLNTTLQCDYVIYPKTNISGQWQNGNAMNDRYLDASDEPVVRGMAMTQHILPNKSATNVNEPFCILAYISFVIIESIFNYKTQRLNPNSVFCNLGIDLVIYFKYGRMC